MMERKCRLCGMDRAVRPSRIPMKKEQFSNQIKKVPGKCAIVIRLSSMY